MSALGPGVGVDDVVNEAGALSGCRLDVLRQPCPRLFVPSGQTIPSLTRAGDRPCPPRQRWAHRLVFRSSCHRHLLFSSSAQLRWSVVVRTRPRSRDYGQTPALDNAITLREAPPP
jgi:hypothetical protein